MAFLAPLAEGLVAGEAAGGAAAAAESGAAAEGGGGLLSKLGKGGFMPTGGGHGYAERSNSGESRMGSFSVGQQDAAMATAVQHELKG
jgi:hypothetical protein